MVWAKNGHYSTFFLGNIGQEYVFYDILERKNAFLGYKKRKFKKSKYWHSSKWVTHGFGITMAIFPFFFFLRNIGQKNVFYDIPRRKNAFLGYKNKKFKKSKNRHFSKGVNPWFWSKNDQLSNFCFGSIGQENVFYDILKQKNAFLGYKYKKFQKSKNWHFPKRVNPWYWSKNGHFSEFSS